MPTLHLEAQRHGVISAGDLLPLDTFLTGSNYVDTLRKRMVVLVMRIMVEHFEYFHGIRLPLK